MSVTESGLAHEAATDFPDLAAEPAESGSLLGSLQRKRAEIAQRGTREIRKLVPLWDGALSIVYRYPEGGSDPIVQALERARQRGKPSDVLDANCDALIACCYTVEGRRPDGEWEPLDADRPGDPLRFTQRLADLLEIDVPERLRSPARHILRHVFSPLAAATGVFDGDISLMTQGGQIVTWLSAGDQQADEELRGE